MTDKKAIHYGTWSKDGQRKFLCSNSAHYDEDYETDVYVDITCKNCRRILLLDKGK